MFGKKKKHLLTARVDTTGKYPVILSSICTGEQVAGFRDKVSRDFIDVMLIRNREDLEEFMEVYGVDEADIKREW